MEEVKLQCPSPKCNTYNSCKSRHLHMSSYPDEKGYRRGRTCQICDRIFLSAKPGKDFVNGFGQMRLQLMAKNQPIVKEIGKPAVWLTYTDEIPLEFAGQFIRACVWWDRHPSGYPRRAPRHANNIYWSPTEGWVLNFLENKFLISKAIKRCASTINYFLNEVSNGKRVTNKTVKEALNKNLAESVATISGEEYAAYPIYFGQIEFGTHSISLNDATDFLLDNESFESLFI